MVSLLAVVLASASASCSSNGQKKEYSVPNALCGVSVPTEPLSRLLPASGKHLSLEEATPVSDAITTCEVTVDGEMVLSVEKEVIDSGRSAWNIAAYDRRIGQAKTADGGTVAYLGRRAVSVVSCQEKDNKDEEISVYIRTLKPGREDEAAMKDLISAYTGTFQKQRPC
ncbi:hypothetical protein ACWDSD_22840 [Streptomyces spiralis]